MQKGKFGYILTGVVGWSLGTSMEASLVLEALDRALGQRQVEAGQLVVHTDHGPLLTASCWRRMALPAACLPRADVGITRWWRACSPLSSTNLGSTMTPRSAAHPSNYIVIWLSGLMVTTTANAATQH